MHQGHKTRSLILFQSAQNSWPRGQGDFSNGSALAKAKCSFPKEEVLTNLWLKSDAYESFWKLQTVALFPHYSSSLVGYWDSTVLHSVFLLLLGEGGKKKKK